MKRMCRTCGIIFEGDHGNHYCESPCFNAHNWGAPERFREQADAFNTMSSLLEVTVNALENIAAMASVKSNVRKIIDNVSTNDE